MSQILLFLAAIVSFWISALCGGGASLVLIPLLSMSMTASQIPAALTIGTFSSSFSRLIVFSKEICWKIVMFYVPAAIPTVWLGVWALKYFNPLYIQFFVGVFLLVNVRNLLTSKKEMQKDEKPSSRLVLIVIGALAGFISGLTGAVGVLFNRFYLKYGLSKQSIVATRAANDILIHLIKIVLYSTMGLISSDVVLIGVLIATGAVISSFSIKYILPLLSETLFRRIGYGAMVVSGLILLTNTSVSIVKTDNPSILLKPIGDSLEAQLAWRTSHLSIEFEYDEGLQLEHEISYEEMPDRLLTVVAELTKEADQVLYEKVTSFDGESYEVYVTKNGEVQKIELE